VYKQIPTDMSPHHVIFILYSHKHIIYLHIYIHIYRCASTSYLPSVLWSHEHKLFKVYLYIRIHMSTDIPLQAASPPSYGVMNIKHIKYIYLYIHIYTYRWICLFSATNIGYTYIAHRINACTLPKAEMSTILLQSLIYNVCIPPRALTSTKL
jgi:hypothetical protein